jgi:hypothetical protein
LKASQSLARTRYHPRAPILGQAGAVLVSPQPVVTVGLVPASVTNLSAELAVLACCGTWDETYARPS